MRWFIVLALPLVIWGCGHKKIKGDRNMETPSSPGVKSGLTTTPESIGMGAHKIKQLKKSNDYIEGVGVGNENYEGEGK